MTVSVFLDTNVLVYAALGSGNDDRKRKRALDLIESEDSGAALAREWIEQLRHFLVKPSSIGLYVSLSSNPSDS